MPRSVLIGGVGYRHLRDHSAGVLASDRLAERPWPEHVRVEDLSFNPVAVAQQLEDDLAEDPSLLLVLLSAVQRGRRPGSVVAYRWDRRLPGAEHVQAAVAEAVTGVINVDNTLVVARQFGGLPEDVVVVEIEPQVESFGDELSPAVARAADEAIAIVERLAGDPELLGRFPVAPLGGGALPHLSVS